MRHHDKLNSRDIAKLLYAQNKFNTIVTLFSDTALTNAKEACKLPIFG